MKKITKESLSEIVSVSDVKASPNGRYVAYVVTAMDIKQNGYITNIHVYDTVADESYQLTNKGKDKDPLWINDDTLLFQSVREADELKRKEKKLPTTAYYQLTMGKGEATKTFTLPLQATELTQIKDGLFYFLAAVPVDAPTDVVGSDQWDQYFSAKDAATYSVFDELPFWSNGQGVVNKRRRQLFVFNQVENTIQCVSPQYMNVEGVRYVASEQTLWYFGTTYTDVYQRGSQLYTYQIATQKTTEVPLNNHLAIADIFHLAAGVVIYATQTSVQNSYQNPSFFLLANDGSYQSFNELDVHIGSTVGTDCKMGKGNATQLIDGVLYYSRAQRYQTGIFQLDKTDEKEIVPLNDGAIYSFQLVGNDIYFSGSRNQGLVELYRFNRLTQETTQITHYNDEYLQQYQVSAVNYTTFVNDAGDNLDCFVIKPVDYDETKKYPAILTIRGGPKGISGNVFFHEMQMFANEGYFVFYTNPRGSDGRGSDFANIEAERYGTWDYQDLMALVDEVLRLYPAIDEKRLGVMGGSYGGFMTNWIVGHTDRFAAGATQRSIANYVTKCLTTDIGYYHNSRQMGDVSIWEDVEAYWDHSPLKYAEKVKTPLLFIHSDEDYRCYMGDTLQFFTALKLFGVPTRYCLFHGENHELSRSGKPANRLKRLDEMTQWMNQYLKTN